MTTAGAGQFASDDPIVQEAEKRLVRAHRDKDLHKKRIDDYYRLVMPWRHQMNSDWSGSYVDEIFDNTALDAAQDFASDMLATFTPQHSNWIDPVPAKTLAPADAEAIKPQIAGFTESVFSEIRRTNFYSEAMECYLDLPTGTMAMFIQDIDPAQPIHCESAPITDILIARGPHKTIDVKAFDLKVFHDQIPYMWPTARENKDLMDEIGKDASKEVIVRQTMWRDYSDAGNEVHKYAAYMGKHLIASGEYRGEGSCPMIVARWLTDNVTCWGIGPGYLQLPNIKTANLLKELILKNLDYAVDPASTYDDDGTINMEQGIQPGTHIPKQPGSEINILESGSRFDAGYFEKQELNQQIKRGFFQDKPDQLGKTPPTATQWLDEASQAARRMGAPQGRLVIEWQYPIFKRFAYLLARRGVLPEVKLNGELVALNPTSPLIRAQRQEEAVQAQRFLAMIYETMQQNASMIVDEVEAAYFIADRMGIDPRLLGNKAQAKEMIQQMRQMAAAQEAAGVVG